MSKATHNLPTPIGHIWSGDMLIRLDTIVTQERGTKDSPTCGMAYTSVATLTTGLQRTIITEDTEESRDSQLIAIAEQVALAVGLAKWEEDEADV